MSQFLNRFSFCMLLVMPFFNGCFWSAASDFDGAVWSDDDSGTAYIKRFFNQRKDYPHVQRKDFELQVFIASTLGNNQESLTGKKQGRLVSLHYMKEAGYVLVGRGLEPVDQGDGDNPSQKETIIFEKVSLDGTLTQVGSANDYVMLSCDGGSGAYSTFLPLKVVPSPDGSVLVVLKGKSTCTGTELRISFLNADNLDSIGEEILVELDPLLEPMGTNALMGVGLLPMAWFEDDTFVIGQGGFFSDTHAGWAFVSAQEPIWREGAHLDCFYPQTTSSHVSSNGDSMYISSGGDLQIEESVANNSAQTFGCPDEE